MKLSLSNLKIQDACTFFDLQVDGALAGFVRLYFSTHQIQITWSSTKIQSRVSKLFGGNLNSTILNLVLSAVNPLLLVLKKGIQK